MRPDTPAIIALRFSSLALIGGIPHGFALDYAWQGVIRPQQDGAQPPLHPILDSYYPQQLGLAIQDEMNPFVYLASSRAARHILPQSFMLDSFRVSHDFCEFIQRKASDTQIAGMFFCIAHDERAWTVLPRLEEGRHQSFASRDEARVTFDRMARAIFDALASHGAEFGLSLNDPLPIRVAEQFAERQAPRAPEVPFSSIEKGAWNDGDGIWDSLRALREARLIQHELAKDQAAPLAESRRAPSL